MNAKKILIIAGNLVLALSILVLVGKNTISWEQGLAGITLLAFPSAASVLKDKGPPPPPAAGVLLIAFACAAGLQACALFNGQEAKEAAAEKAYREEQYACVDAFDLRAEIEACRREVRKKWGIVETVRKDGGK